MNILYTITSFRTGGAEKLVLDMINHLAQNRDDSISFVVINNNYDENLLKQIDPSVKVFLLNREEGGEKLKYLVKYNGFIRENKIDVIHCQCIDAIKFSMFSKLSNYKVKLFYTVHDTNIFSNLKAAEVIISKIFSKKIIAISDSVKKEILEAGIKEEKVERVYNSIDISRFSNVSQSEKIISEGNICIGNVARIVPEKKGQDLLIKAVSELKIKYPNIRCIFAGSPPMDKPEYLTELQNMVKAEGVDSNIVFLGNVKDVPKFLSEINVFVMPSRYEGFGISLIEAMASGIPCIASDIDGPKEIIKDKQLGLLFESDNYKDLAKKIEFTVKNGSNFDRNIVKEYINENFNIDKMMNKMYEIYSS